MTEIIQREETTLLSFGQRWNGYLALVFAAFMLFMGITLRNANLNATQILEDLEAGVRAQVPAGWLVDTGGADYVFLAQDPNALPFKTILQVSVLPVGENATPDLVLDLLHLYRAPRLSTYGEISRTSETLRGDPARRMMYAYVEVERNPFQASVPVVVQAVDVVVLRRGQAIIITYREERSRFDEHLYRFENLLSTVEIF